MAHLLQQQHVLGAPAAFFGGTHAHQYWAACLKHSDTGARAFCPCLPCLPCPTQCAACTSPHWAAVPRWCHPPTAPVRVFAPRCQCPSGHTRASRLGRLVNCRHLPSMTRSASAAGAPAPCQSSVSRVAMLAAVDNRCPTQRHHTCTAARSSVLTSCAFLACATAQACTLPAYLPSV